MGKCPARLSLHVTGYIQISIKNSGAAALTSLFFCYVSKLLSATAVNTGKLTFWKPVWSFWEDPPTKPSFSWGDDPPKKWSDACLGSFRKSTTMTEHHNNLSFMFTAHPSNFDPLLWNIVLFILIWFVETPNLPPKTNMEIWRCKKPLEHEGFSQQVFSSVMTWTRGSLRLSGGQTNTYPPWN